MKLTVVTPTGLQTYSVQSVPDPLVYVTKLVEDARDKGFMWLGDNKLVMFHEIRSISWE